jgi:quercetin dioxygenase-like cupin family protein
MKFTALLSVAATFAAVLGSGARADAPAGAAASASEAHTAGVTILKPEDAKYQAVAIAPACNTLVGMRGDPTKEAATFLTRMTGGCVVPWHWHKATEEVVMLKGTAVAQMKDGKPVTLTAGAYTQLPSRHVHRFRCSSKEPCFMYVVSDAPFGITYVAADGTTLQPSDAIAKSEKEGHPDW